MRSEWQHFLNIFCRIIPQFGVFVQQTANYRVTLCNTFRKCYQIIFRNWILAFFYSNLCCSQAKLSNQCDQKSSDAISAVIKSSLHRKGFLERAGNNRRLGGRDGDGDDDDDDDGQNDDGDDGGGDDGDDGDGGSEDVDGVSIMKIWRRIFQEWQDCKIEMMQGNQVSG